MKTKLLASAALAVALGFSSWSAGAASYANTAPVVKTAPVNAADMEEAKSTPSGQDGTKYMENVSGEFAPAPKAVARPASTERAFKTGVGPATMFQLRERAGGDPAIRPQKTEGPWPILDQDPCC